MSGDIRFLHETYGDRADFLMVYIREAHPKGGWEIPEVSVIADPMDFTQRALAATQCTREFGFEFPTVVDDMLDSTAVKYAAWPDRLYVVGPEGRVLYAGGQGPRHLYPRKGGRALGPDGVDGSLEAFLEGLLGNEVQAGT